MLGDTEITPPVAITTPAPPAPMVEPAPPVQPVPTYVPKPKSPLGPILLGFFLVVFLAGIIGVMYFKAKFTPTASPSPSPSVVASPSPEPSLTASSTPSASRKPVSALKPGVSPTPTPVAQPTLDIRFGNPSANVKQTYDDGTGRVINREYTSIQAGQFDELSTTWSPRVTVCFHIVANEAVAGKDIKFSFSLDDKISVEDNLGGYDKLEPGHLYDWCHDLTTDIGKHTAKLLLNPDKSVKEANYVNDLGRLEWENLADNVPPNYTITGPTNEDGKTCFTLTNLFDNVTKVADLKLQGKIDGGEWVTLTTPKSCTTGVSGSQHTGAARVTDARGNINEQTVTFVLY